MGGLIYSCKSMSIIVSVKIHDGIVMAADSATTFYTSEGRPTQIYEHVDKIVNLVKGAPIGIMTCGSGSIGSASIATLMKDLRRRLSSSAGGDQGFVLGSSYSMQDVAQKVQSFVTEKVQQADFKHYLMLRLCGYSSDGTLPEVWDVVADNGDVAEPFCVQAPDGIGVRWCGETEAINRLILGLGWMPSKRSSEILGISEGQAVSAFNTITDEFLYESLIMAAAPIQDAIDLSRFLVETTKGFIRFAITRTKTVGGPVEIAAITKHEGFKWVQRKHFYPYELNRTDIR
jgi:20S proteasome alpha/beta subunit